MLRITWLKYTNTSKKVSKGLYHLRLGRLIVSW